MMIIKKNEKNTKEKFLKGNVSELVCISPNIADRVMAYADKDLNIGDISKNNINLKTHSDSMDSNLFIYSLISAKLKGLFSISEAVMSITAPELIEKFDLNIFSDNGVMCEGNMRAFINKMGTAPIVSDELVNKTLKKNVELNKEKKSKNKKSEDEQTIRKELQTKSNGHVFVEFFNNVTRDLISSMERPTIHILDCVKIPVNITNSNYELSTVINYEGKPMRGYKMGVLRGVTEVGGIIENLIDGTISDNDLSLVRDEILEYPNLKEGDYLIADRGFCDIKFVKSLHKKGINVIIPVKKSMEIYQEAIANAKNLKNNEWQKHPNNKRKGQDICLIENLKGTWLEDMEKQKKPEKMMETALDFSACVVRIEKEKNKDIVEASQNAEDEMDILYEDEKYIYIVVVTTNVDLTAGEIIRHYELRPEIEEDFRQLKDIWKMCTFTSTKYIMIMCHLAMTFLAYNLFNLYKKSAKGRKYINKSMRKIANEEQREYYLFDEIVYFLLCGKTYCLINGMELLDLYAECSKEAREKIRPLLSRTNVF